MTPYKINQEVNWYQVIQHPFYHLLSVYGLKMSHTSVENHFYNYLPWKRPWPKVFANYIGFPVLTVINCVTCTMSLGRLDELSNIFQNKDVEEGNSRTPSTRKRDELTLPTLVEQTSASTLVREEHNETTNHSQHPQSTNET